eukprot:scaffold51_cov401-Prasinococcus_capsulatus_cf.AAC.16
MQGIVRNMYPDEEVIVHAREPVHKLVVIAQLFSHGLFPGGSRQYIAGSWREKPGSRRLCVRSLPGRP